MQTNTNPQGYLVMRIDNVSNEHHRWNRCVSMRRIGCSVTIEMDETKRIGMNALL